MGNVNFIWLLTKKYLKNYKVEYLSGLSRWLSGKEPTCNARDVRRHECDPWDRKIPWRRKWQPTPVFFLGNPIDRGVWKATVHGVTKSQTQLSN